MDKTNDDLDWEKRRGIDIQLVQLSDFEDVRTFMHGNFYPDEPLWRSFQILETKSSLDKALLRRIDKFMILQPIENSLKTSSSLVARCSKTGKIVATRFGEVLTKEAIEPRPNIKFLGNMPNWVPVPKKLRKWGAFREIFDQLPAGQEHIFSLSETKDSRAVYFGHNLCVAREARGLGLAQEMVKRSHRLAESHGCSHSYAIATGICSQKIFHNLGYKTKFEVQYADHEADKRGRPLFHDHGEHKSIKVVLNQHP